MLLRYCCQFQVSRGLPVCFIVLWQYIVKKQNSPWLITCRVMDTGLTFTPWWILMTESMGPELTLVNHMPSNGPWTHLGSPKDWGGTWIWSAIRSTRLLACPSVLNLWVGQNKDEIFSSSLLYSRIQLSQAKNLKKMSIFFHFLNLRILNRGFFLIFLCMYFIQYCFICRPSNSTVSEDAGIEPRTVATSALAVRRSSQSATSHPS